MTLNIHGIVCCC